MGLMSYFTFFGSNAHGIVLDHYENSPVTVTFSLFASCGLICTMSTSMNRARYVILNAVNVSDDIPRSIWICMGMLFLLGSSAVVAKSQVVSDIIELIVDMLSAILIFLLPPIFVLNTPSPIPLFHRIMCCILICVAVGIVGSAVYLMII
jgi:hypothetical protein